ncbi:MAG: MBL fold metallo-hydrolase [Thermoplasmata archaeon]
MKLKIVVLNDDLAPKGTLHLAQHGVSYYIETQNGSTFERILFDTGSSYLPIKQNAKISNVDLKNIESIVISHCHYDHTGGLYDILNEFDKNVFAHPSIFRENFYLPYRYIGVPKDHKSDLMNRKNFIFIKEHMKISENITMTGEVPRENGFEIPENMFFLENGQILPDMMKDDNSIYIDLGDSIFLISGCSHAGIVNIKNYVERISGKEVKYILGGLHLLNAGKERINFTIENLERITMFLGHCTGDLALEKLKDKFGDKVKRIYSGFEVEL